MKRLLCFLLGHKIFIGINLFPDNYTIDVHCSRCLKQLDRTIQVDTKQYYFNEHQS